jgi:hypothetical protein
MEGLQLEVGGGGGIAKLCTWGSIVASGKGVNEGSGLFVKLSKGLKLEDVKLPRVAFLGKLGNGDVLTKAAFTQNCNSLGYLGRFSFPFPAAVSKRSA